MIKPTEEEFVSKNRNYSGINNAKLMYKIFDQTGEFPNSFDGNSANSFLATLNSLHMHRLLKEVEESSKKQTKQFWISIIIATTALLIAGGSLYLTYKSIA